MDALPNPPRPLTPALRRRAWGEPTVRFWWVLALVVLVLSPVAGWGQIRHWRTMHRLSAVAPTNAVIKQAGIEDLPGRYVKPGDAVRVSIGTGSGSYEAWGDLAGWADGPLPGIGETIAIRIDPDDRTRWAVVHKLPTLASALLPTVLTATLALAPFAVSLLSRRFVLNAWALGTARPATIRGRHQTALAPRLVAVRCSWAPNDDEPRLDRSIFTVYVPAAAADAAVSDPSEHGTLTVLDGRSKRVAAAWFLPHGAAVRA